MPSAPAHRLDPALVQTMAALARAGFHLLPLGGGGDGKAPLCRFDGVTLSLRQVMGPMSARGSHLYGIRLEGLVVLDLDTDDPALVSDLEARFGPAAVHVQTSRGRHLWYRAPSGSPPNLRREGLPVDMKSGINAYVAGPGSVRPDGQRYVPAKGDLASDHLAVLGLPPPASDETSGDASTAPASPALASTPLGVVDGAKVPEGQRHEALKFEAIRAARTASSPEDLLDHLRLVVSRDFACPGTFPDAEIAGLASWAWRMRTKNSLWGERASAFTLRRDALDVLRGHPHQDEAVALYVQLVSQHGHLPGVVFPLDHAAMKEAGLVSMGRRSFLHARRALEASGFLRLSQRAYVGVQPALYQLCQPRGP